MTKKPLFPVHPDLCRADGTTDNCLFQSAVQLQALTFSEQHRGEHHTPEEWEAMFLKFLHEHDPGW
jgi:hypothetical protein